MKYLFLSLVLSTSASAGMLNPSDLIRSDYKDGEVTRLCEATIEKAQKRLDAIATVPEKERTIDNTLMALEETLADLSDEATPLTFMGYVSTNEKVNGEGSKCEESLGQFSVAVNTRRDLYVAIKDQKAKDKEQSRLLEKTLEGFELNGLKLSDDRLAEVKKLKSELSKLETQFSTNLNQEKSSAIFTADELAGVPESVLSHFKKLDSNRYEVETKENLFSDLMQNASKSETRRKMLVAYLGRGGDTNLKLMEQAIGLRAQIAKLMGFATWADYRTANKMAKSGKPVMEFLESLKGKLAAKNKSDFAKLLRFKQELDPAAKNLDQWDINYLSYQLKKRDFNLDNEKIREYFPADLVIGGLFKVYSEMLGVRFQEVANANVWADGVKLYEIRNSADGHLIGYFYADFFPRAGKYGHAAAFPLISGRRLNNGAYSHPVSAIVANLTAPAAGKPSLMTHDEVETVFHEFGHIMHQTLTRAPYASLSGSSTPGDFVEGPSQMLENWVWSEKILSMISGHYQNHAQKLPADLLKQMLAARNFNQGVTYTKQLLYGLFDMSLHTEGSADVNQTYENLYRQVIGSEPVPGGKFPAGFGHLMGGYDAGYYGYLWSKVFAQDMFSKFPASNLTSAKVGGRYRRAILEQGNMKDPSELLREFLGRDPKPDAFFKMLGIK